MDIPAGGVAALAAAGAYAFKEAVKTLRLMSDPVADQLGKIGADLLAEWRVKNFIKAMQRVEEVRRKYEAPTGAQAGPRIAAAIVQEMSWIDDPVVQDMWAGLLSSACTPDGDDDSNLIFVNLLSNMTKLQARVLNHVCRNATMHLSPEGLVVGTGLVVGLEELRQIAEEADIHRLDRELDVLRDAGLLSSRSGIHPGLPERVEITPTPLALHMYIRASGSRQTPAEFFNLALPKPG